ncbi:MAG: hypothetical protein ACI36Y_05325 [Coriobacteriales bacterium]
MARGKRVDIEGRIAAAEEQVLKAKERYDRACAELKDLIAKRDAMRKDELWEAVAKSERSYEEILAWVKGPTDVD